MIPATRAVGIDDASCGSTERVREAGGAAGDPAARHAGLRLLLNDDRLVAGEEKVQATQSPSIDNRQGGWFFSESISGRSMHRFPARTPSKASLERKGGEDTRERACPRRGHPPRRPGVRSWSANPRMRQKAQRPLFFGSAPPPFRGRGASRADAGGGDPSQVLSPEALHPGRCSGSAFRGRVVLFRRSRPRARARGMLQAPRTGSLAGSPDAVAGRAPCGRTCAPPPAGSSRSLKTSPPARGGRSVARSSSTSPPSAGR